MDKSKAILFAFLAAVFYAVNVPGSKDWTGRSLWKPTISPTRLKTAMKGRIRKFHSKNHENRERDPADKGSVLPLITGWI